MEIADWYYRISGHYREGFCVDLDDCREGIESYRPDTHIQITNKEIIKELNKIKYGE